MRLLGTLLPETRCERERLVLLSEEEYQELLTLVERPFTWENMPILKGLRRRGDLARLVKHLETLTEVLAGQEAE